MRHTTGIQLERGLLIAGSVLLAGLVTGAVYPSVCPRNYVSREFETGASVVVVFSMKRDLFTAFNEIEIEQWRASSRSGHPLRRMDHDYTRRIAAERHRNNTFYSLPPRCPLVHPVKKFLSPNEISARRKDVVPSVER